jgi:hypothetical protein
MIQVRLTEGTINFHVRRLAGRRNDRNRHADYGVLRAASRPL